VKAKQLNFIISLKVYPFDVMVSFGETDKELQSKLNKYSVDYSDADWKFEDIGLGRAVMFSSGQFLLRYKKIPISIDDYGHLQHEIFHIVHFLMHRINTPLNLDTCETWAYLIGYITSEVYKKLQK